LPPIIKGVVHFKKKQKTFADNLLTPMSSKMSMSFFFSRKEIKVFDENMDFLHIMDFFGNQKVQGPNESFSAASKGFKRHQTMNNYSFKTTEL